MKKTSNTQRGTLNIEWSEDGFCRETPTEEYRNNKTPPKYDLEDRLLDFAVNVVELTESLPNSRSGNHIAAQLLRCGTSPLSKHGGAEAAESGKDFLHKLRNWLMEPEASKHLVDIVAWLNNDTHHAK